MSLLFPKLVDIFLDDAQTMKRLRPATLKTYVYELRLAAQSVVFQVDIGHLTLETIEHWIARNDPAPSTCARRAATFNHFYAWAVHRGYCVENPVLATNRILNLISLIQAS